LLGYSSIFGVQQFVQLEFTIAVVSLQFADLAGQLSVQVIVAIAAPTVTLITGSPFIFLLFGLLGLFALLGLLLFGGLKILFGL